MQYANKIEDYIMPTNVILIGNPSMHWISLAHLLLATMQRTDMGQYICKECWENSYESLTFTVR